MFRNSNIELVQCPKLPNIEKLPILNYFNEETSPILKKFQY
jgi:hypothetical protein